MSIRKKMLKKENSIWAMGFTLILMVVIDVFFDYYFDINDDILLRDFVSGAYAGRPSGYNVFMRYPLSFLLSIPYYVFRTIHWYDLFFLFSQFGCIYLITERLLNFCKSRLAKGMIICVETGVLLCTFLGELVFIQFTSASGLFAITAAFLIYTNELTATTRGFLKINGLSIVLCILSFMVRPEMFLMMFPFVCVVGICKWAMEKPIFTKNNFKKYFSLLGIIVSAMAVVQVIHAIAYGSEEWKEYLQLSSYRSEIYDYHDRPSYAENTDLYDSINMNENDCNLLIGFCNLGLDDSLDSKIMKRIKDYVVEQDNQKQTFLHKLKSAFSDYRQLIFRTDNPYNIFVFLLYGMVLITALCNGHLRFVWEEMFLGIIRSGIWMFILFRGRVPERITHPLYLVEIVILIAFLLEECKKLAEMKKKLLYRSICIGWELVITLAIMLNCPTSVKMVREKYDENEKIHPQYMTIIDYVMNNKDNFYFFDVYSLSPYRSKLLEDRIGEIGNYEMIGSWGIKTPLSKEKYQAFSFQSSEDGLIERDNVFLVVRKEEKYHPDIQEWTRIHYADRGINVTVKEIEQVIVDEGVTFVIYQFVAEK